MHQIKTYLPSLIRGWVVEGEDNSAQLKLQFEQFFPFVGWGVSQSRELSQSSRGAANLRQTLETVAGTRWGRPSHRSSGAWGIVVLHHGFLSTLRDGKRLSVLALYNYRLRCGVGGWSRGSGRRGCRCRRRGFCLLIVCEGRRSIAQ